MKNRREYVDLLTFNRMAIGNYFGARVLVPYDFYASLKRIYFGDHVIEPYNSVGKA
jgi:hypothetical protein